MKIDIDYLTDQAQSILPNAEYSTIVIRVYRYADMYYFTFQYKDMTFKQYLVGVELLDKDIKHLKDSFDINNIIVDELIKAAHHGYVGVSYR